MVPSKNFLDELARLDLEIDESGEKPVFRHRASGTIMRARWSRALPEDLRVFSGDAAQINMEQVLLDELREAVELVS